jgi:transcriptional regulator with XRE-family HTH domain
VSIARLAHYQVDASTGLPEMRLLEVLRYRRFVDLDTAAREIGCWPSSLRSWERGRKHPSAHFVARLERIFGKPWDKLAGNAPALGLTAVRKNTL